jgi:hypothetical protein
MQASTRQAQMIYDEFRAASTVVTYRGRPHDDQAAKDANQERTTITWSIFNVIRIGSRRKRHLLC